MNQLRDAYIELLQDLYDAEQQITQALPQLSQAVAHQEVKRAFEEHLYQTQGQIQRLEQILRQIGQPPGGKTCRPMQALIQEAQEKIQRGGDPDTLDAVLIACAQKVEHYEIAGYGTARSWALHMNEGDAAELLQQTADEEGQTDKRLTDLAQSRINREALPNPQMATV
jgi:ferritin-like metal-binding protein YciE